MQKTARPEFPVDNASILFLSLIKPYHTNSFRFSMTLTNPIDPEALQEAVNRIHKRFPSVIAAFRQDFFHYAQVASAHPPSIQPDPGLLRPMTAEELKTCALRVLYRDCTVSLEVFHALTDGNGTLTTLTTLISEYLDIVKGVAVPVGPTQLDVDAAPQEAETEDAYLRLADVKPRHLPSRFSYLPAKPADSDWQVRSNALTLDIQPLLDAAHRYDVTLNTFLTSVLAASIMELHKKERPGKKLKPVRLMIPIDLRRMIGSRTLRNCSLYTLPTMEGYQHNLPLEELCKSFDSQLKAQLSKENQSAMASYNVRTQNAWYFRFMPWKVKSLLMRLGYRFFGESNSSLTLTNLGLVRLPEELYDHVTDIRCWLTPRVSSPYGCTVLGFNNRLILNMSRFCPTDELGEIFFRKIKELTDY